MRFFTLSLLAVSPAMSLFGLYVPLHRCPGDFSVEAEWIYFAPTSETVYYVEDFNDISTSGAPLLAPNGQKFANRFDKYSSGWRVGAAYSFCDCDNYAAFTYSQLKTQHQDSVTRETLSLVNILIPNNLLSPPGQINQASAQKRFDYYSFDVIFGHGLIHDCCIDLDIFGGIHYANLRSHDTYQYVNNITIPEFPTVINAELNSTFWGIGPQFGFAASGNICGGFSLVGQGSTAMLIGSPHSNLHASGNFRDIRTVFMDTFNESAWIVVPYADLRLGVSYNFDCSCFSSCVFNWLKGGIEVGYEGLCYFNGLTRLKSAFADTGLTFNENRNVTMHGPYIAASLRF